MKSSKIGLFCTALMITIATAIVAEHNFEKEENFVFITQSELPFTETQMNQG